jgi:RNA-directed DNA polymerase
MDNTIQLRIEASCFYNLKSPHKLAEYLGISFLQLQGLAAGGRNNYHQFESGKRWIETPLPTLKRTQRRIHDLLTRVPPPEFLFSAYRNRSSVKNAEVHSFGVPMAKLDIRHYFPSTDGNRVFELFNSTFQTSHSVAVILRKLCTITGTQGASHCHLPTGGVTSPILSYFCYREMFESLSQLAIRQELALSVFADDITFSGKTASAATLSQARRILAAHGLVSNSRKEKVWSSRHGNKLVTGALITPKGLRVPFERKQKIQELKESLKIATKARVRAKLYQQLHGSLSSAGQIEPRFLVGAKCLLQEWKGDKPAWAAHTRARGAVGNGH